MSNHFKSKYIGLEGLQGYVARVGIVLHKYIHFDVLYRVSQIPTSLPILLMGNASSRDEFALCKNLVKRPPQRRNTFKLFANLEIISSDNHSFYGNDPFYRTIKKIHVSDNLLHALN